MPGAIAARNDCVPAALQFRDGEIFSGFPELLALEGHRGPGTVQGQSRAPDAPAGSEDPALHSLGSQLLAPSS